MSTHGSVHGSDDDSHSGDLDEEQTRLIEGFLQDPSKKAILRKLLIEHTPCGTSSASDLAQLTSSGTNQMGNVATASSSGTNMANLGGTPPPWWFQPPYFPPPYFLPHLAPPHHAPSHHSGASGSTSIAPSRSGECSASTSGSWEQQTSSRKRPLPHEEDEEEDGEEDAINLLSEAEALELVEFDPSVQPEDTWEAPPVITEFLEKHFNKSLSEEERKKILDNFPKPSCDAAL